MRVLFACLAMIVGAAAPASAQTYFDTIASFRHGHGYAPATVVAGWEKDKSFTVIAIAPDGDRVSGSSLASDWKATIVTGPRAEAERDDADDDRYLDKKATNPTASDKPAPPVERTERFYVSIDCPVIARQLAALKPLTSFAFNPPSLAGNEDGPRGDGREGLDLWIRVGDGEINKEAGTGNSMLGKWFADTLQAFNACPAKMSR